MARSWYKVGTVLLIVLGPDALTDLTEDHKAMPVEHIKFITRSMLRDRPGTLFVFGDNLMRKGYGGQAKEMRGMPNAVGIPTKRMPGTRENDYFTDDDFAIAKGPISRAFEALRNHLAAGGDIVWPEDGVGTGLAELSKRAPAIWHFIEENRIALDTASPKAGVKT